MTYMQKFSRQASGETFASAPFVLHFMALNVNKLQPFCNHEAMREYEVNILKTAEQKERKKLDSWWHNWAAISDLIWRRKESYFFTVNKIFYYL